MRKVRGLALNASGVRRAGFTLVELLVVVAIIGILATRIVINLNAARMRSRDARRVSDVDQVKTMLNLAYEEKIKFPTGGTAASFNDGWTTNSNGSPTGWMPAADLVPKYTPVLPVDPVNDTARYYMYRSNGADYKVISRNPESELGRDKAINDGGASATPNRNVCISGGMGGTAGTCDYEIFSCYTQTAGPTAECTAKSW